MAAATNSTTAISFSVVETDISFSVTELERDYGLVFLNGLGMDKETCPLKHKTCITIQFIPVLGPSFNPPSKDKNSIRATDVSTILAKAAALASAIKNLNHFLELDPKGGNTNKVLQDTLDE